MPTSKCRPLLASQLKFIQSKLLRGISDALICFPNSDFINHRGGTNLPPEIPLGRNTHNMDDTTEAKPISEPSSDRGRSGYDTTGQRRSIQHYFILSLMAIGVMVCLFTPFLKVVAYFLPLIVRLKITAIMSIPVGA
ncbi:hypothetical protein GGS26DRAFT_591250 [Hypomontagnella submonticulosa]|nr:hypothetical protein GGS26DRAFT_591250 [Hypomontagnella submonticulosa]